MRSFTCEGCGGRCKASGARGRLPSLCEVCRTPQGQRLVARVRELEAALSFDAEAGQLAALVRVGREETGRDVVGRAVRRLAHAQGRVETRERLLEVAAACRAWARHLAAEGESL